MKTIVLDASLPAIDRAFSFVVKHTSLEQDELNYIYLVIEEMIVNISSYAYEKKTEECFTFGVMQKGKVVMLNFEDAGVAFNPFENAPKPDLNANIEERLIGGLGIHFVKSLSQSCRYERVNGRNYVAIEIHFPVLIHGYESTH